MAASNAGVVFVLNAISFLGVIVVLALWRYVREHRPGAPRLRHAMREGMHYIRATPVYHAILIRSGLFSLAGSALWAMLPVVAASELGSTSTGYGILLGCLGTGSVLGAGLFAPLRARLNAEYLLGGGIVVFASATVTLALAHRFSMVAVAMLFGGVAWLTVMTTFNVVAQTAPPTSLRARALAMYILVFQGALSIGSTIFGALASHFTVRSSLLTAAALLLAGLLAAPRLPLSITVVEDAQYVA